MAQVVDGRFTARMDEPFVVFIIGIRINRPLAVRKWLPTFRAMGPMLRELYRHPEKGFLGGEFFFYGRGPALVQYWRSFKHLEKFARNPDDPHMRPGRGSTGPSGETGAWKSSTRPTS
jgi:Monooxygenase af470-like